MSRNSHISVAWAISPHGYGHAARSCAIMESIHAINEQVHFEIFTTVPEWFFADALPKDAFSYHHSIMDVGLVQDGPMLVDLVRTLQELHNLFLQDDQPIRSLSYDLIRLGCRIVICDISPVGIMAAKGAQIPSVLVENFTWGWIYKGYLEHEPGFLEIIDHLNPIFGLADYRIQTKPLCETVENSLATINPISRKPRTSKELTRTTLGIQTGSKMVLVTMGGIPGNTPLTGTDVILNGTTLVIPGTTSDIISKGMVISLPHHSDFYHPDLVHAADVVIGKVGYSTIAEVFSAGVPFGYIPRPGFRESEVLQRSIRGNMQGIQIPHTCYLDGSWVTFIPELLALRPNKPGENGAGEAGELINDLLLSHSDS